MDEKLRELPPKPGKPRKKPNILLRSLAFLLTLALVLGAVALVVYRDNINFDAIKRLIRYQSLDRTETEQAEPFPHSGSARDIFALVGGDLLTCSTAGVRLYSESGTKYVDEPVAMQNPAAVTAGIWALAYDIGGRELRVIHDRSVAFSLTLDSGESFLSARINSSGLLAATIQKSGYRGSVLVYDGNFTPQFQLNLSSSFVMDAAVIGGGETLAVVTMGQSDGLFQSRVELYAIGQLDPQETPTPTAVCPLDESVILDLWDGGSEGRLLGEDALFTVSPQGTLLGSYDFSDRYLKAYALSGDSFSALLLGRYQTGSQADLVLVGSDGSVLGSLSVSEQVLSLSAAGRYLAVLTADRLDIYTSDLTLYRTLEGTQGAQKVLMNADGTAMLVSSEYASLYIPG